MTNFSMDAYKNGEKIKVSVQNNGKYKKPKPRQPLSPERIVGIDTESRVYKGQLTTVTTQIGFFDEPQLVITADHEYAITAVFDALFPKFSEKDKFSYTKQRAKRDRGDGKGAHRDGSRKSIAPVLGVFYNLEYDAPRLFGNHPQFMRTVTAEMDNIHIQVGDYDIEMKTCLLRGGAPNFEFNVRRDHRVMRLIGIDMWGYWKSGLDKTAKQLLGPGSGKEDFDVEDHDQTWEDFLLSVEEEKANFFQYSITDCRLTRDIYIETVKLLMLVDSFHDADTELGSIVIRQNGVIPVSAPSAAARIAFAMGPDEWDLPPEWVYKMGAKTYAGARVFNTRRTFVEYFRVNDISSAYPHVMSILPDPATCHYQLLGEQDFNIERWKGQWGVMEVSGYAYDGYYPPLRIHDEKGKRLRYFRGAFTKVWATIPEIVIGVVSGRLRIDKIHQGCHMQGSCENSFLRKFILHVYAIKSENEKDSPLYLMAKLLMNALYGKLVEIQMSNKWIDERCFLQPIPKIPDVQKSHRVKQLEEAYRDGEDGLDKLREKWVQEFPDVCETINVIDVLGKKTARAGQYYLPMHGAQITGFVSAKIGLAAYCTQAVQGDTDSIMFDESNVGGMEAYRDLMLEAGYDCPEEGLGSFETEVKEASGYFLKTKMYGLKYEKKIPDEKHEELLKENEVLERKKKETYEFVYHDSSWHLVCYKCANHGMRGVKSKKEAYVLLEQVFEFGKAEYKKKQVRKFWTAYKNSIKTGEIIPPGEFFDITMKITAPNNPDLEEDEQGFWIWKELETGTD